MVLIRLHSTLLGEGIAVNGWGAAVPSECMLKGKMWQFQRGDREELVNAYYYLKGMYPITDKVYARQRIFGTVEDKTMPDGVWLFALKEDGGKND